MALWIVSFLGCDRVVYSADGPRPPAGRLVASFGEGGVARVERMDRTLLPQDAVPRHDGGLVVGGHRTLNASDDLFVAAVDGSGIVDTTFGTLGYTELSPGGNNHGWDLRQTDDGEYELAGTTNRGAFLEMGVARFTANGNVDIAFGAGGWLGAPTMQGSRSRITLGMAGGGALVGGSLWSGGWDVGAMRIAPDGRVDTAFGAGGLASVALPGDQIVEEAAPSEPCCLYLASPGGTGLSVRRLTADGSLDAGFAQAGLLRIDTGDAIVAHHLVGSSGAGLTVVVVFDVGDTLTLFAAHYLPNGQSDPDRTNVSLIGLPETLTVVDVLRDPSGAGLLMTGARDDALYVVRIGEDAAVDGSFGVAAGGWVQPPINAGRSEGRVLAVLNDGNLAVAGTADDALVVVKLTL